MELKTTLDVDLVALETADEVAVLLDIAAPPAAAPVRFPQVVLDRAGSMAGERLRAAEEVGHLLEHVAQAVSLVLRPASGVPAFTLWNELPVSGVGEDVMVELGDFYAGEQRRILLSFQVPGMFALGPVSICDLELRWVDLASMTERLATIPVNVNVVSGEAAVEARCRSARAR